MTEVRSDRRLDPAQRQELLAALARSEAVRRLAALPRFEYDRQRLAEAKRLGVRVGTLDAEVGQARGGGDGGQSADCPGLLADIRWIFDVVGAERIASRDLVARLVEMPGRPWARFNGGGPLDVIGLATLLRPMRIQPRMLRVDGFGFRGYRRKDFTPMPVAPTTSQQNQ